VADDMKKLELARGQVQTSGKVRVSWNLTNIMSLWARGQVAS
jgi:hypothetical protein